jgi:benzoate transport
MATDPRDVLTQSPMGRLQVVVVGLTIVLNALDGFDVMSISFASPGIATEWGMDRAGLGIVLSMELIGMAIGSIVLGGLADRIGRRPTVLACLGAMAVGMFMATTVTGLVGLSIWRVITGLGIGGMLAAINAVAAEFSNNRRKALSVSLMSIGYPVGAVVGGIIAAQLLKTYDWRSVFYLGAITTAVLIPVVYFVVPESVHWLARKQPAGALEQINAAMKRMGYAAVTALPAQPSHFTKSSVGEIFHASLVATTVIVTLGYFFHITTFYYIVKWVPKIVADFGFAPSAAAGVLVWVNVGGAIGGTIFGFLTQRFSVKALTIVLLLMSTIAVVAFGQTPADLQRLSFICAVCGFCINAGIVGLYALIAQAFPTHVRASGTGFAIGVGRGGAVIAPIIAGFLFNAGYSLPTVSILLAMGSLFAAAVLLMLRLDSEPASQQKRSDLGTQFPAPGRAH